MDILLRELQPGGDYRLQIRAKDTNGNVSPWSQAYHLTTTNDSTAPATVTGLTFDVSGGSFVATWVKPALNSDGSPLFDLKDYKVTISGSTTNVVYFVAQEKFDFSFEQNVASFGVPEADLDISVQARDTVGNLSIAANANAVNAAPPLLTGFTADEMTLAIGLSWDESTESDFKKFNIYVDTVSGFTPGPSNHLASTSSTSYVYTQSVIQEYFFKIEQEDLFGQKSGVVSASATPATSNPLDIDPTDPPTGVVVSTVATSTGANILVSWDAVTGDLGGYKVRYGVGAEWSYVDVPAESTTALLMNLIPGQQYYVAVASYNLLNDLSAYTNATDFPIVSATDTTPPEIPAVPTVVSNVQAVQVSHDMKDALGVNLASDTEYLEVHAGATIDFATSASTKVGDLLSAGPGIFVSAIFSKPTDSTVSNLYWRVIAVDRSKNKSDASDTVMVIPGLVSTAYIGDLAVTNAKIADLDAGKLQAGTAIINDLSIESSLTVDVDGHIQSSNFSDINQTGYSLDETGLKIYDGSISANSLLIQDGSNIMIPAFTNIDYESSFYAAVTNYSFFGDAAGKLTLEKYDVGKYGSSSFRIFSKVTILETDEIGFSFAPPGDAPVAVHPGDYIFSAWVRNTTGTNVVDVKFGIDGQGVGDFSETDPVTISSTTWQRISGVLTVVPDLFNVYVYIVIEIGTGETGFDILMDGLQIERKISASEEPSSFKLPGSTAINGAAITTGSIRSTADSTTVEGEPAWFIDLEGNIQVGDAVVKGSLVVGKPADGDNMMPVQFSDFSNVSSFYHNGSNVPNADNFDPAWGTNDIFVQIITSDYQFAPQCLRAYNTTQAQGSGRGVHLTKNAAFVSGNNVPVVAGNWYTLSAYVKSNNLALTQTVGFAIWTAPEVTFIGNLTVGGDHTLTGTWTRIYGYYMPNNSYDSFQLAMYINSVVGTGFDFLMDGIMIEPGRKETPSTFTPGTTGLSQMKSANFDTGLAGWYISSTGDAEFNAAKIRGTIEITGTATGIDIRDDVEFISGAIGSVVDFYPVTGGQMNKTFDPLRLMIDEFGQGSLIAGEHREQPTDESTYTGLSLYPPDGFSLFAQQGDPLPIARTRQYIQTDSSDGGMILGASGEILIESESDILLNNIDFTGTVTARLESLGSTSWGVYPRLEALNSSGTAYGWTSMTLSGGWSNRPAFWPCRARINAVGNVEIIGTIQNGTQTSGTVIATLPNSTYYPNGETRIPGYFSNGANLNIIVKTNGQLVLAHTGIVTTSTLVLTGSYPIAGPALTP